MAIIAGPIISFDMDMKVPTVIQKTAHITLIT